MKSPNFRDRSKAPSLKHKKDIMTYNGNASLKKAFVAAKKI